MEEKDCQQLSVMFNNGEIEYFMVNKYYADDGGFAFKTSDGLLSFDHDTYIWMVNPLRKWPKEWDQT